MATANLSGTLIKGYELRERIDAGGFGVVYRAYQSSVVREVAIKIILPHFANHPDFIRRFESEAQLVARLEHLHIVPLYDYWRDTDGAYLVMRWLRGGSLRDALKDGPFDLASTALLLDQITSALAVAHRNQVIHRDLKPGNVLLDEDGNAYLADFGIAKDLGNLANGATQADVVVGSPDYLSPEQARSEPVSPQTDIYSLGVMLYEVLTAQHPFPNVTPVERMYKHLNEPLPLVTTLPHQLSDGINGVIQSATAKDPTNRYPDVLALAVAFREAAALKLTTSLDDVVETLTRREQEVLERIIAGQSNKQIAQELFVALPTVKWYIRQLYSKLHVRSRVQAIIRARELKLITSSSSGQISIDGAALAAATVVPTDQFKPDNPYKGLRAFQAADSRDFFGRETLTQKLVARLGESGELFRFLAVIGPSGSGKSSLVKAGLIPALWKGALPGSERWFVAEMLPGAHPLDELEITLTRVASNPASNLSEQLQRDARGLLRVAQLILPNDDSQLVLVIDQFEEVFTLVEDEKARVHFLKLIQEAVADPRSRVRVVVTLRADFYDRPLLYPDFGELVRSRMETVLPLTADGLERAIARPAERVGLTFEPGLVASIVSEVNYQPGALPLLQYALTELFERRQGRVLTQAAYKEIGGTVGALARRADEVYEGLDANGEETARQLFLRLVTLGEGVEDTRRRVPRSELIAIAADEELMDELIDTYAAYRLLSLDNDPGTRNPTVEVAHEAILREWKRLRGWLNDNRHDIRMQRLLAAAAAEWFLAERDISFLLRGSRLEQFQAWVAGSKLALTPTERDYLDAGLAERERQTIAEQKRQAREKTLERRSRDFLRGLVGVLLLATFVAVGLTAVAQQNAARADRNAAESQNVALVAGSQAALATGNTDLAIALALNAVTLNPTSAPAQVALDQAAYAPGTVRRFIGHTDDVYGVAFSPDGRTAISISDDGTMILWDVATGAIIRRFSSGHTAIWGAVAFSPDGRTVLSGAAAFDKDKVVILHDVASGNIIRRFEGHTGGVTNVRFSPDGRTALSTSNDKTLILWDVATGAMIRRFTGHTDTVSAVAFSADGQTALSVSSDKTLILWDVSTGTQLRQFGPDNDGLQSVDLSRDGRYAVTGSRQGTIISLWDMSTGQVIRRLKGHNGPVTDVKFSPDGKFILSGSDDASMILWDVETGQILRRLGKHANSIQRIAFSPDGRFAFSASADHTLRLWDLSQGYIIRQLTGHKNFIPGIAVSPDGLTGLSASWDGTASVWNLQTGQELHRLTEDIQFGGGAAYFPDGHTALVGGGGNSGGELILWNLDSGEIIRRIAVPTQGTVSTMAVSPDGRTILSGELDASVLLWDEATGKNLHSFVGQTYSVLSMKFSPDGHTALTGDALGGIILWDVATGQPIHHFVGQTDAVIGIAFSKDGRTVLTEGVGNGSNLWDTSSGTLLRHLLGGSVFSPDETTTFGLAGTAVGETSAVLVDIATGNILRRFSGFDGSPYNSAFLPDGHSVLVAFTDGKLELWRLDSLDQLIAWTHANRYVEDLPCDQRVLYKLTPACDANGAFPSSTSYPTALSLATAAPP